MAKRMVDVVISLAGLAILAPLLAVIAIGVKLDSAGPVLHRGRRVGRGGASFRILKFRSMVAGADRMGPGITAGGDARVTRIGRILRKAKLDELPQLFNVLRGEMSLVGPRPEDPRYVELYTAEQRRVLTVRPGITSLASVAYRNEEAVLAQGDRDGLYVNVVMPAKLSLDLDYVERMSLWADLTVIARTLLALFRTEG